MNLTHLVAFKFLGGASASGAGDGCFFGGDFFGGDYFCGTVTPTVAALAPAGRSTRDRKKRKVLIGDRLYEVDSLKDIELLLKRIVRTDPEPVVEAAKARVRVVDRVRAKVDPERPVSFPIPSVELDWSGLWNQLAIQDMAYARELERVLQKQEEDDLESILLLM